MNTSPVKRWLCLLLMMLMMTPAASPAEMIIWPDENGVLHIDEDDVVILPTPEIDFDIILDDTPAIEKTTAPTSTPTPLPTPTPTPSPEPTPFALLQYGSSGEDVLHVQNRLTEMGYYFGKCSGDFLEGTQSAVRRFQKYNGLYESGRVNETTWNVLFSSAAIARDGSTPYATPSPVPTATPEPTPTPTPTPFVYKRLVQYGDQNAVVSALQTRLSELGYYEAKVSGGYYEVTQKAVRAFQQNNGLSVDGIAGRETQEMLFSSEALPVSATPRPTATPAPAKYLLTVDVANQLVTAYTYDENGEYTIVVREMVCSTGTKYYPTPLGTTIMPAKRARWGYFPTWGSHAQYLTRIDSANAFHSVLYTEADERTLNVKSYEDLGSPASHGCVRLLVSDAKWIYDNCQAGTIITVMEGEYDPEYTMSLKPTLNTGTLRENPLPEPTPTPTYARENFPTEYRTLYRGRSGEDVFMVQMRLKELGYYNGTITGGYYGGTIAAVEAFQRDHGLTVDGAAGKQTQKLLFSEALDPTPVPTATPAPTPTAPPITPTPEPTRYPFRPDSVG